MRQPLWVFLLSFYLAASYLPPFSVMMATLISRAELLPAAHLIGAHIVLRQWLRSKLTTSSTR
jgi:hypothetical protein